MRERYPRQLSGGQQQRVALARALVNEPTVLLLDEPLAALDLKLRKAMQDELKGLQERVGITFVYVTHDQEEALTLSDRIGVMNEGRILQIGSPKEIYDKPTSRFVADFIGQTNFFEGVIEDGGPHPRVRERAGFELICTADEDVSRGASVWVSVRPERVVPGGNGSNTLSGRLTGMTYLGDLVLYRVALPDGREVVMQRQTDASDPASGWHEGQAVQVSWDRESARVLVRDEGLFSDEGDEELLIDAGKGLRDG
jgi:spermidine/putrescine transport system ATP-binding protein